LNSITSIILRRRGVFQFLTYFLETQTHNFAWWMHSCTFYLSKRLIRKTGRTDLPITMVKIIVRCCSLIKMLNVYLLHCNSILYCHKKLNCNDGTKPTKFKSSIWHGCSCFIAFVLGVKDIIPLMVCDMCFTKNNCVAIVAIDTIVVILCYEGNKVIITTKRFFCIVKQLGFWPICNNLVWKLVSFYTKTVTTVITSTRSNSSNPMVKGTCHIWFCTVFNVCRFPLIPSRIYC
jgi:hypothetical protein